MMRIDSHQHFWYYHPQRESWITDDMAKIRRNFLPEDLKPILDKNKMDGCIAVQANDSEDETEFLLHLAQQHPFIKGVVGWVDLTAENVEERLSYFSQNPLFKGIRHTLQAESVEFITSKSFQRGIAKLNKFGLSYNLLVLEHQLAAATKLVRNFPEQRFVLDHLAKPQISKGVSHEWKDNIQELAQAGNVYCKISGLVTETANFEWTQEDFVPFLDVVLKSFGEDKLVFGSDWPVCLAAAEYSDTLEILNAYFSAHGENVSGKIFGSNAMEFYRL